MSKVRVMADVTINMHQFDNLADDVPGGVLNALQDVSQEALQIAKENSRVDNGDMQNGWRRSQIGFKSTIKAGNENPGYRIYNNTLNKYGDAYTQYHEFGTEYIEAQPMLGPAVDYIKQMLGQKVLDEVNESIGRVISQPSINIAGPSAVPMRRRR